jgi:hypothetical protein
LLTLIRSVSRGSRPLLNALIKFRLLLEVNTMLFPSLLICPFLYLLMYSFFCLCPLGSL